MLLFPSKNMDPDLTVIAVSTVILRHLKKSRFETIENLRNVIVQYNKRGSSLIVPSLQLLFLLGLIEYHSKNDLVEYIPVWNSQNYIQTRAMYLKI